MYTKGTMMKKQQPDERFNNSEYQARIRLTQEDLDWLNGTKQKKSAAGFLREIIKQYKKQGKV